MFTPPPLPDARKMDFAREWAKLPSNPYLAAYNVFQHPGMALIASEQWVYDPEVISYREQLISENDNKPLLPDKTDVARLAFDIARDEAYAASDRLNALNLYAKLNNMIERPPVAVVNNSNQVAVVNKVMVIPSSGSAEEWEVRLKEQQKKLVEQNEDAKSRDTAI